ncbi:hypothetical protein LUZ62_084323 [Rhynchospora pubera]|uniref:Uncharacterized protein n=1 Tax=Rhynchospora pubera TaxID=906938 RepID=A0AAV8ARB8_9POAL|nr:hypothetical protein LUZ62_003317 [Rhynchospora pubera]KAJ4749918.1 hypothetical protein LUZ62_084323 [Rhynchospora pubera]
MALQEDQIFSVKKRLERIAQLERDLGSDYEELFTIFRVPTNIREANKSLYEPRVVPIGPYYYKWPHLTAMECHKWRFLKSFLRRNNKLCVEAYIQAVGSLEMDARQCYSEMVDLSKNEFVEMLLLDGCFILELFFKWLDEDPDVLIMESWGATTILSDLLLMDNQIPFIVIERLCNMIMEGEAVNTRDTFLSLLANFLMDEKPSQTCFVSTWPNKINHLLDLYHQFLIVPDFYQEEEKHDQVTLPLWKERLIHWNLRAEHWNSKRFLRQIPGATELYEAGVQFKKKQSPKTLFDIKFNRGILEIPPLQIDSNKKTRLANLVALERHKTWGDQIATSYVALMDSLINTKEDVALLQHAGVIHNKLSSHQEAAIFFNQLGDCMSFDTINPHFADVFRDVQLYYDSSWNRSLAHLVHDYFHSPWAIISVIAGVILLGLTALQAFFTVYRYYHP